VSVPPHQAAVDFTDRIVLLTGGAGDLGRAIVAELRERGARVAVNDIIPEDEAVQRIAFDDRVTYLRGDAAEPGVAAALLDGCERAFDGLPDTLCCHAGVVRSAPILEIEPTDVARVLHDNVVPGFALAQEQARRWIAQRQAGLILFTSSWVQDVPWPGIAAYSASKAAVRAIARSFARELAPHGIRANVIAPGIVGAGMAKRQWDTEPEYQQRAKRAIPLGALQSPESVANTVVLAMSPLAEYMTGATLLVDGGASLYPMD
jgi:NAD(P)-dependent dehydrogenase (short-subunit alcohol dehydrogenase family)